MVVTEILRIINTVSEHLGNKVILDGGPRCVKGVDAAPPGLGVFRYSSTDRSRVGFMGFSFTVVAYARFRIHVSRCMRGSYLYSMHD